MKAFQQVLFLCTGNYYRSRHAEAIFNHLAERHGIQWRAISRGFRPHLAAEPLSHFVEERLEVLDISPRPVTGGPQRVEKVCLAESSLVIAMNHPEHAPMILEEFPLWKNRVRYWAIPDLDLLCPDHALPLVEAEVELLIGSLLEGHALGRVENVLVEF